MLCDEPFLQLDERSAHTAVDGKRLDDAGQVGLVRGGSLELLHVVGCCRDFVCARSNERHDSRGRARTQKAAPVAQLCCSSLGSVTHVDHNEVESWRVCACEILMMEEVE